MLRSEVRWVVRKNNAHRFTTRNNVRIMRRTKELNISVRACAGVRIEHRVTLQPPRQAIIQAIVFMEIDSDIEHRMVEWIKQPSRIVEIVDIITANSDENWVSGVQREWAVLHILTHELTVRIDRIALEVRNIRCKERRNHVTNGEAQAARRRASESVLPQLCAAEYQNVIAWTNRKRMVQLTCIPLARIVYAH